MLREKDAGGWNENDMTPDDVLGLLREKFKTVSFNRIKEDVVPNMFYIDPVNA